MSQQKETTSMVQHEILAEELVLEWDFIPFCEDRYDKVVTQNEKRTIKNNIHNTIHLRNEHKNTSFYLLCIFQNAHLHGIKAQIFLGLELRRLLAGLVQKVQRMSSLAMLLVLHFHHVLLQGGRVEV